MLYNLNDEKEITHLCLLTNGFENRDPSKNDDVDDAYTSDDEKEDEKIEYDIQDEVYDFLDNYFECKLIKVYLHYIRC